MRKFYKCSDDVKTLLFNTYCSNLYGSHLWTSYKKVTLQKLKVTYNNALRKLFGLRWDCRASAMYVDRGLIGFDALRRKYMTGFMERLRLMDNTLVRCLINSTVWGTSGGLGHYMDQHTHVLHM